MRLFTFALLLLSAAAGPACAAEMNPAEAKLRENLRNTMLQMRTVEGERDALQAEKAQVEAEKKALAEKAEALGKQLVADKDAADRSIATLSDRTAAQAAEIAQLTSTLEKWKASQKEAVALAQSREAARAALVQEKLELQRKVADQKERNAGMYRVAKDILARYESFGLGTAIAAREPFTGTMRTRLENLVQDLGDQAAAQRIRPEAAHHEGGAAR